MNIREKSESRTQTRQPNGMEKNGKHILNANKFIIEIHIVFARVALSRPVSFVAHIH